MTKRENRKEALNEDFIKDLLGTCMQDGVVMETVFHHLEDHYLPDKYSIDLLRNLKKYYKKYNRLPSYTLIRQKIISAGTLKLLDDIHATNHIFKTDECIDFLEDYIRGVKIKELLSDSVKCQREGNYSEAEALIGKFTDWARNFTLGDPEYTDIVSTFESRYRFNCVKNESLKGARPVTRFYIDELDEANRDRNLRTQLTCILASTGVGKTHAAQWIGSQACKDGYNVLHIQLEGSKEEVENAYSAAIAKCDVYCYEHGKISDKEINYLTEKVMESSGRLFVRAYPKFNQCISTLSVKEAIHKFRKIYEISPDIVIIDSMDLLTDSSGKKYSDNGERHKRIAVANDLKDLAGDENVWMVVTYQATIENTEWLNDEKNVLTEYNCAEAKGLSRPLTHLLTLNQSANERREHTMRIHVAKSRFFAKGDTIKIATDYDNGQFYDRQRSINLIRN